MTTVEHIDVEPVLARGAQLGIARREVRVSLEALKRRMSSPARYRMVGTSAGAWNFTDWEGLTASISYLREMGYDLSTLRVEAMAAASVPRQSTPKTAADDGVIARAGVPKTSHAVLSGISRRFGVVRPAA